MKCFKINKGTFQYLFGLNSEILLISNLLCNLKKGFSALTKSELMKLHYLNKII